MAEQERARSETCPAVSAVIPAYNAAETIERALDSVYAQTYDNIIEVIVVDDGSEDNTAQIVREKYPDVTLIQQENAGNAGARNTGVAAATGEYIAFLDADDEWLPEKTSTQMDAVAAAPGLGLVTCQHITLSAQKTNPTETRPVVLKFQTFKDWIKTTPFTLSASAWVVGSACYRAVGGLEEELDCCVDVDFLARLSAAGYCVAGVERELLIRHLQPVSVSRGPGARLRRARMNLKIWQQFDPRNTACRVRLLSTKEYDALIQKQLISVALAYAADGDTEAARAYARRAAAVPGTNWLRRLSASALSAWPSAVSRVYDIMRS